MPRTNTAAVGNDYRPAQPSKCPFCKERFPSENQARKHTKVCANRPADYRLMQKALSIVSNRRTEKRGAPRKDSQPEAAHKNGAGRKDSRPPAARKNGAVR